MGIQQLYIGLTKGKIDRIIEEYIIHGEYWDEAINPIKMMKMVQG